MLSNPTWENLSKSIQQKISQMSARRQLPNWQKCLVPVNSSPASKESEWVDTPIPHAWSSADGEAWFRVNPSMPVEIEGISLAGSRLCFNIFMAIGAKILVNGIVKFKEDWWLDTRPVEVVLEENYQPGKPLKLEIRANAFDGFGFIVNTELLFSKLEEVIFNLDLFHSQLAFTYFLATFGKNASQKRQTTWENAARLVNLDALATNDWAAWNKSVETVRTALSEFADEAKTYTSHMIAHSHIDMNWLWPWKETVEVCRRDFSTMDKLMRLYPDYKFSQSQAATYFAMQQEYPEIFKNIKKRIKEGRWEVTANTWVEGDLNMAAGETLIRHLVHTRSYIQENFGVTPLICWEPDTFGHPATIPQILAKSGIKYYYFCRAGKRHPLFWWEGPDGSRVLAVQDLRGYGGPIIPTRIIESVIDYAGKYSMTHGIYLYGAGDHGGGATASDIEGIHKLDNAPLLPHVKCSTTEEFFTLALKEAVDVPVVRDELNTVFEGCYTSHGNIKRFNRQGENLMFSTETTSTVASLLAGLPQLDLAEAWRTVCFHQFHDILCGCAIGVTYREADENISDKVFSMQKHLDKSTASLAAVVDTRGSHGKVIVVFNPLAWVRSDIVEITQDKIPGWNADYVVDDAGNEIPLQKTEKGWIFVAENIPSLGLRTYLPSEEPSTPDSMAVIADSLQNILENSLLKLRVNPNSGALDLLLEKNTGHDFGNPWGGWGPEAKVNAGMINRFQILWEQPHSMSAWNIGDITRIDQLIANAQVKVIESGPVRGTIEVRHKFLHSSLVQRIHIYRSLPRIDFETIIDWHEKGGSQVDAPMLRAVFTPNLQRTRAAFEIPFGGLERLANGSEVPALRWMDLTEENGTLGISLLNDCKYGHSAQGNTMGISLVRASYEPDNNPDEGLHPFIYSLYPHQGSWKDAGTIQRATELNQPLLWTTTTSHPGAIKPGQSWLTCTSESVIVSSVKMAEEQPQSGKDITLRLYESHGKASNAVLHLATPAAQAVETDLLEKPITSLNIEKGITLDLVFTPYEIKTIKLHFI